MGRVKNVDVMTAIEDIIKRKQKDNMENIVNAVCTHVGLSKKLVLSKTRVRKYVDCRRMIYKLIKSIYGYPVLHIAKHFKKNHATILNQLKTHEQLCEYDQSYNENYMFVMNMLIQGSEELNVSMMLLRERFYYQTQLDLVNEKILIENEKNYSSKR